MEKQYLVSYDLDKPGQDYTDLISALKRLGAIKPLFSEWVLSSSSTAMEILTYLRQFVDANDRLLVMEIAGQVAWVNLMVSNEEFKKAIAA